MEKFTVRNLCPTDDDPKTWLVVAPNENVASGMLMGEISAIELCDCYNFIISLLYRPNEFISITDKIRIKMFISHQTKYYAKWLPSWEINAGREFL